MSVCNRSEIRVNTFLPPIVTSSIKCVRRKTSLQVHSTGVQAANSLYVLVCTCTTTIMMNGISMQQSLRVCRQFCATNKSKEKKVLHLQKIHVMKILSILDIFCCCVIAFVEMPHNFIRIKLSRQCCINTHIQTYILVHVLASAKAKCLRKSNRPFIFVPLNVCTHELADCLAGAWVSDCLAVIMARVLPFYNWWWLNQCYREFYNSSLCMSVCLTASSFVLPVHSLSCTFVILLHYPYFFTQFFIILPIPALVASLQPQIFIKQFDLKCFSYNGTFLIFGRGTKEKVFHADSQLNSFHFEDDALLPFCYRCNFMGFRVLVLVYTSGVKSCSCPVAPSYFISLNGVCCWDVGQSMGKGTAATSSAAL